MSYQLVPVPLFRMQDNNNRPLSGGLVYTYQAGTTNPQASYPSSTSGIPNPNPVQLNARGEAQIWLDPALTYKINVTDFQGNQIPGYPVDNIPGGGSIPSAGVLFQTFTASAGQTVFTSSRPLSLSLALVILDAAVLTPGVNYTVSGLTLTLTNGALAGQTLIIWSLI